MREFIDGCQDLGLTLEPGRAFWIGGDVGLDDLQRHSPLEDGIGGAIHLAHCTRVQWGEDILRTESGSRCEAQRDARDH